MNSVYNSSSYYVRDIMAFIDTFVCGGKSSIKNGFITSKENIEYNYILIYGPSSKSCVDIEPLYPILGLQIDNYNNAHGSKHLFHFELDYKNFGNIYMNRNNYNVFNIRIGNDIYSIDSFFIYKDIKGTDCVSFIIDKIDDVRTILKRMSKESVTFYLNEDKNTEISMYFPGLYNIIPFVSQLSSDKSIKDTLNYIYSE